MQAALVGTDQHVAVAGGGALGEQIEQLALVVGFAGDQRRAVVADVDDDLLRQSGWSYREMEVDGYALPVIDARCAYLESAKYDDELEVRTAGTMMSPVRVQFTYEIVRASDGARLAKGATVHATLDRRGRPCRLPERVRTLFA